MAIEFALALPVILVLLTGVIDLGFFMDAELVVIQAARDAARTAVATPSGTDAAAAAQTRALERMGGSLVGLSDVRVSGTSAWDPTLSAHIMTVVVEATTGRLIGLVPMPATVRARTTVLLET